MKCLLLLLAYLASPAFSRGQTIVINNTRTASHLALAKFKLSLVPPAGYAALPDDAGFFLQGTNPEDGNEQIKVSKFFLDFQTVKQSLLSSGTAFTDVSINSYEGVWIKTTENVQGHVFTALTLGFGNSSYSYVVVGAFPSDNASIEAKLTKAVQSAYVDTFGYSRPVLKSSKVVQQFAAAQKSRQAKFDARFHVDVSGTGFMLAEIVSNNHFIYTLDGAYPPVAVDKSQFDLGYSSATVSENSFPTYSSQILYTSTAFNTITNLQSSPTTINGLKGIEIVADAKFVTSNSPIKVYQLTLFESNGVYSLTGIAYNGTVATLDNFKKIAKTFSRIP